MTRPLAKVFDTQERRAGFERWKAVQRQMQQTPKPPATTGCSSGACGGSSGGRCMGCGMVTVTVFRMPRWW